MTKTLYPHPPYYFVTLSKLTESRFFFNHPPTFSDNVTLYHGFFWTTSLTNLLCSTFFWSEVKLTPDPLHSG